MTKTDLFSKIVSFKKLKKNWDSYGAEPINIPTIELALSMVPKLETSDDWFVAPCSNGEILFESEYYGHLSVWKGER